MCSETFFKQFVSACGFSAQLLRSSLQIFDQRLLFGLAMVDDRLSFRIDPQRRLTAGTLYLKDFAHWFSHTGNRSAIQLAGILGLRHAFRAGLDLAVWLCRPFLPPDAGHCGPSRTGRNAAALFRIPDSSGAFESLAYVSCCLCGKLIWHFAQLYYWPDGRLAFCGTFRSLYPSERSTFEPLKSLVFPGGRVVSDCRLFCSWHPPLHCLSRWDVEFALCAVCGLRLSWRNYLGDNIPLHGVFRGREMGTGLCCRPEGSAADHLRRLRHRRCDLAVSKIVAAPISLIVCYFSIGTDETLLFAPRLVLAGI